MMLMAELSEACWECSSLSITRLLQAVLLSDFNYKLVSILTSAEPINKLVAICPDIILIYLACSKLAARAQSH